MNSKTDVSVLLPFYNPGPYFEEAIESIIKQSFVNWELVLINNNSTAEFLVVAEKYAAKEKRIKLISESKQGISFALNRGLKLCRGKYIARMDADDFALPQRLEKQFNFLEENPEISVVSCRCMFSSSLQKSNGYRLFTEWQNGLTDHHQHFRNRFVESPVAHPSVMFRKYLTEDFGAYSEENLPEDYELWLRWMSNDIRFYKLPEILMQWNDHGQRLSRTHNNYSPEKFDQVKIHYLTKWLIKNSHHKKNIIICGTGKEPRQRAELLQKSGVNICGFTDVKQHSPVNNFIPPEKLSSEKNFYLINFITRRGTGNLIRKFLEEKGFKEEENFILAG